MNELFEEEFYTPENFVQNFQKYKCKHCKHFFPRECGSKIIFYCVRRKSNRTESGLLKIKANDIGCELFLHKT